MRFIIELLSVFIGAVATFFKWLTLLAVSVAMFTCYVASLCLLVVSGMSFVGYLANGSQHLLTLTVVYLVYAAVAFAVPISLAFVPIRLKAILTARSDRHAMQRISGLRLASDAPFHGAPH